jgi:hypothetical protein
LSRKDNRKEVRELLIFLAFAAPGTGLVIWGISSCAAAHHFGMPGALGVFPGLGLFIVGEYYYYRTKYKGGPGRHTLAAFIGTLMFSAFVAYLVNHVLFR